MRRTALLLVVLGLAACTVSETTDTMETMGTPDNPLDTSTTLESTTMENAEGMAADGAM